VIARFRTVAFPALLLALSVTAQYIETRTVHGTVTNSTGKPVAGAVVKLKNLATLQVRSYLTDEDGSYTFHGVRSNVDYEVKAGMGENESDTEKVSRFNSDADVVIDLRLAG
jgi:hypothetical protein